MIKKTAPTLLLVAIVGFFVIGYIWNSVVPQIENNKAEVQVIEPISSSFSQPDTKIFNNNSVNPTKEVRIEQSDNPDSFRNTNDSSDEG